jgi:hypothetical protein
MTEAEPAFETLIKSLVLGYLIVTDEGFQEML